MKRLFAAAFLLVISLNGVSRAGDPPPRQLTLGDIVAHHPISGSPPSAFVWAPNGSRYAYSTPGAREKDAPVLHVHDMRTSADRVLLSAKDQSRGSRSREITQIAWSSDGSRIAFLNGEKLEVANGDGTNAMAIATDADDPQWSPGGTSVAYIRDNDIFVTQMSPRVTTRLTTSGSATRINGDPDWLYSEEMNVAHAYRWSPDGRSIAFLSFDESPVTQLPIQRFLSTVNTVEYQRYPLAGGHNPRVALRVVDVQSRVTRTMFDGAPHDDYVLSFTWTPDSSSIVDEIVDRPQQHLRLVAFSRSGAATRTILTQSDSRFVDVQEPPVFSHDGRSFYWLSERDGVQALYRVDTSSGAAQRLTGRYPVAQVERIDEHAGVAYVTAFYPTRRDRALLSIPLRGGAMHDLTPGEGSHVVAMPAVSGSAYIETASSFTSPPVIELRSLQNAADAVLFRTPDLSAWRLGNTLRLEIPSQWGNLDAQLTEPRDFNPAKKYPVVVTAYGGPLPVGDGLPTNDRWQGLFPYLLAQHGFLVFSVDGPASNGDRANNARMFYQRMGEIAMAGQLAGVAWLKTQPYVDTTRLGLYGWSYGGYLTAFTLTHAPNVFRAGIAGGPPADWRFYDSAYTERYMGMPQTSAVAYRRTSVLPDAPNLRAQLLIVQGTSDDNVHLMNSLSLVNAFIAAGRTVDYFAYPGARHGVRGIAAERDLDRRMLDWWERTLQSRT